MRGIFVLLLTASSGFAAADVINLVNSDRISGELVQLVDGQLTFHSELIGVVEIDWNDVAFLQTERAVRIAIKEGDEIVATIWSSGLYGLKVGVEGKELIVPMGELVGINLPEPVASPTKWEGALSSSLGVTQSNRDAQNFNLDFDIARERATDRLTAKAAYAFSNQSLSGGGSETTVDSWYARSQYDVIVSDKFFWYGGLRFDRDRVADLDLRTVVGAGAGLTLWNNKTSAFRTTFGLSFLQESFTAGQQNNTVALQIGTGLKHEFNSWLTVLHDTSYYPNPSDFGDFFLSSELVLRSTLASNMFAEFKFVFDYDATPAPGAQKDNYRYTMGVGMRF